MRSLLNVTVNTHAGKMVCKTTCADMDASISLFENVEQFLVKHYGIHNLVRLERTNVACADGSIVDYKAVVNLKD